MPIITISRGCCSYGRAVAEQVAKMLGYKCISREILIETARSYHISEEKLFKSLHDSLNLFERLTHLRDRYLQLIQATLLKYALDDNLVYHGNAGHFLIPEVKHLLKVRIIADLEDRIRLLQQRDNLERQKAVEFISTEDNHRKKWTQTLYNEDLNNPQLYDLVIHLGKISVQQASILICSLAKSEPFQVTALSKQQVKDHFITAQAKILLQGQDIQELSVNNGIIQIKVKPPKIKKTGVINPNLAHHLGLELKEELSLTLNNKLKNIPGVKEVVCEIELPQYS